MTFTWGDHVCAIYSTVDELAGMVGTFLLEGLLFGERCWYVASGDEVARVRVTLGQLGVDVEGSIRRGALNIVSADQAYLIRGVFDPDQTVRVFNTAIEQALVDGFSGLRAAADMSWALGRSDSQDPLIEYEARLRTLFSRCRATGLCLYPRVDTSANVIAGALATHPIVSVGGHYQANPFYDPAVNAVPDTGEIEVLAQLNRLAMMPSGASH